MAYNTKPIVTDVDGNPISQYYNKELDQYEPLEGQAGANKVVLYNADGTENNSLSLQPILDKLSQLTGTVIDEETRKSNELERIENEDTRQFNEDIRYTNEIERIENEDIRIENENTRINNENIRKANEQNRIDLYNDLMEKVSTGYFNGKNLEFHWNGTSLGVRVEGDSEYIYVDLKGETGDIENLTMQHVINALGYTPIKSVNNILADEAGNVELDIDLTSQHIEDALGYTPVKSVNNVLADEAGNVELDIDTSEIENRIGNVEDDLDAHKAEKVSDVGGVHGLIYEEGTWTPTLEGATVAGVQTYSRQEGSYIRINNIVTVFFWVNLTAKDVNTTGTLVIKGLPFKPAGIGQNNGVTFGKILGTNLADPYTSIVAYASGNPQFSLFKVGQNVFESLFIGDIEDDFQILGSLTYKI